MLRRLREFLLILISAILLVLPFHFGELWILSFFAFVPYFCALENKSAIDAAVLSFIFGFVFYVCLGYWLTLVNVIAFLVMAAYLSLYFAAFGMAAASFQKSARSILFIPAFWVVMEYLRGWILSGIPWALLAHSQWKNIPFIQIADVTGVWGVSFFVMMVNFILFRLLSAVRSREKGSIAFLLGVLGAVLILVMVYGTITLRSRDAFYKSPKEKARLRVSVIQGNIPQDQKWNAKIKGIIFEKYKRLTLMAAVEKSDLIVWPETSFPGYIEDEPILASQLRSLVRQSRTDVLVGAPTLGDIEKGLRFYNSAILYGPDGEEKKRYHKVHLVPFGEFVPFQPLFGFIRNFFPIGHFSAGSEKTLFILESRYQKIPIKARFSTLICYEDIFPGLVRDFCKGGADFLINMTNDAWFGKTTAPYQHAQASVFRAVENRVNVVRATNTGYSCFISPEGRILARVEDDGREIFVTGHKGHDLILRRTPSFYTRFGDVFMLFVVFLCFLAYRERAKHQTYSRV